ATSCRTASSAVVPERSTGESCSPCTKYTDTRGAAAPSALPEARTAAAASSAAAANALRACIALAEREHVGLCARLAEGDLERAHRRPCPRLEEGDLERPVGDRPGLPDQLVEPLLGDRAVAQVVDVEPVRVAGRLTVDQDPERHGRAAGGRPHDEVHVPGVEA